MTLIRKGLFATFRVTILRHSAECRVLHIDLPNIIMLSAVMLNVVMLNVIMLNVVSLSVVGPKQHRLIELKTL